MSFKGGLPGARGAASAPDGTCGTHRELVLAELTALSGNSGVIMQPPYKGYLKCEWIVRAPQTAASSDVSILFDSFHVAEDDLVTVYECVEPSCASVVKVDSFSSFHLPFSVLSDKGHGLKITLESDSKKLMKGFLATYCPAASAPCNSLRPVHGLEPGLMRERGLMKSGSGIQHRQTATKNTRLRKKSAKRSGRLSPGATHWKSRISMQTEAAEHTRKGKRPSGLGEMGAFKGQEWPRGSLRSRNLINLQDEDVKVPLLGHLQSQKRRGPQAEQQHRRNAKGSAHKETAREAYLALVARKLKSVKDRTTLHRQKVLQDKVERESNHLNDELPLQPLHPVPPGPGNPSSSARPSPESSSASIAQGHGGTSSRDEAIIRRPKTRTTKRIVSDPTQAPPARHLLDHDEYGGDGGGLDACQMIGCQFGCINAYPDGNVCDSHQGEVRADEWDDNNHENGAVEGWCNDRTACSTTGYDLRGSYGGSGYDSGGGDYYGGGGGDYGGGGGGYNYDGGGGCGGYSSDRCSDQEGYEDAYGLGCDYYKDMCWECGWNDWGATVSSYDACCACGGGDLCATAVGGATDGQGTKKCGCKDQCTDVLDFSGSASQETLTSSLDTDWGIDETGWEWDQIYRWSDCFWIVQTNGTASWLDINITNIPPAHFVEISSCHRDGKKCCFPETFGQTIEGSKITIRMANPPTFLRLDLKTYEDVDEYDSSQLVMQVKSFSQSEPPAVCGDGLPSGTETCDDGNMASFDGCSSECTIEDNWICKGDLAVDIAIEIDENTQQTVNVRGGPMFCKQMCTTDNPVCFLRVCAVGRFISCVGYVMRGGCVCVCVRGTKATAGCKLIIFSLSSFSFCPPVRCLHLKHV